MKESGSTQPVLRFGPFELDSNSAELRKSGSPIKLHGQPFKVLVFLATRPGQVLTREEISREIWGADTFVDFDQGLNFCIKQIRTCLGDDAKNPRYIETLPRRGYRFIAPVEPSAGDAAPAEPAPRAEPAPAAPTRSHKRLWTALAAGAAAVLAGYLFLHTPRAVPARRVMLLVLPFDNLSGDPQQEYFSDGMTEEMITHIGRLDPARLGVIARTSAMRHKLGEGETRDIAEIGRELNADYILEGSVRQASGRVRITARLNQVSDRSHLWTGTYDRDLRDVLSLQAEVARDIAQEIRLRLSPHRAAPVRPIKTEVYHVYLKGRFFWNKRSLEGLTKAAGLFEQAVTLDPGYPAAHAGLADAYTTLGHYGLMAPGEAYPKAKAAAARALELDPDLAEAHTALAATKVDYDWDWQAGRQMYERALALNPNYATAHQWFAYYLSAMGKPEDAVAEVRRALELDPLSPLINAAVGRHLIHAGHYDEALEQERRAAELDPGFWLARLYMAWARQAKGAAGSAVEELEQGVTLSERKPSMLAALAEAQAAAGRPAEARKTLADLTGISRTRYVSPFDFAIVEAGLGNRAAALDWLERAYRERSPSLVYLKHHPRMAKLASEPRFQALIQRLRLP